MSVREEKVVPLGWKVSDWCRRVGICPATFYNMDSNLRPQSVKIIQRRLIIEAPEAYLKRLAGIQDERAA